MASDLTKMLQVKEATHKRVKQGAVKADKTIDAFLNDVLDKAEGKK